MLNLLKKDLSNISMVKLQTIDIHLGSVRPSFFSLYEMCPEIRQMHTMAHFTAVKIHKPAMENVNNLDFALFQSKYDDYVLKRPNRP